MMATWNLIWLHVKIFVVFAVAMYAAIVLRNGLQMLRDAMRSHEFKRAVRRDMRRDVVPAAHARRCSANLELAELAPAASKRRET